LYEDTLKELIMLVITVPYDKDYCSFQWFLFAAMAILELIVLLNLLIAIISDTFEKVQEG